MSKDYNYEVGYEALQKEWGVHLKRTPRGVSLAKKKSGIYLQFKTPNRARKQYPCACSFSIDGMHEAVRKSHLVKAKLANMTSETEFWDWYEKEIEEKSKLIDDKITFGEAIKKVEDDFWSRPDRRKRKRSKANPSDLNSWYDTYHRFYRYLDPNEEFRLGAIEHVIEKWEKGTKTYKGVVSAMKKLATLNRQKDVYDELAELNVSQTKYRNLSSITMTDFLDWRKHILDETTSSHPNTKMNTRRAWLWVFSIQVVYGLRIHEVFAIANTCKPYITKDGTTIPALNDTSNTDNILVLQDQTLINTTTKTGYRLARPQIPPKYPDLIEVLEIKRPLVPSNKPRANSFKGIVNFYNKCGYDRLRRWNAPTTETHALRHLANINGMQAGIPLEVRAQSMGHTPAMNDSVYKKRQGTQTTIDLLLNSNQNAIDFVTALTSIKNLVKTQPEQKQFAAKILSTIYQKSENEIFELL